MAAVPHLEGEVVVFDGHDVARISPKAWPSLINAFSMALLRVPEEPLGVLTKDGADYLKKRIAKAAVAGLLTVEEASAIVDEALKEGFEE